MKQEPGRLALQRYFTGDLEDADALEIRSHLENCAECSRYIEELEAEKKRFLNLHPVEEFLAAGKKKKVLFGLPGVIHSKGSLVPASVVALLLLFIVAPLWFAAVKNSNVQEFRYKGSQQIQFLLKRDGVIEKGNLSETFRDGDQIQVMYESSGYPYVALFSVDNKGNIHFYHPDHSSLFCTVDSDSGTGAYFPSSIIVDDQGENELIVLMLSNDAVKTVDVKSWIENQPKFGGRDLVGLESQLQSNVLGDDSEIHTLLIRKQQGKQ